MLKVCAYNVRKAPIRDLLISIHKTRDFEWQTAHTKGCQENRCGGCKCEMCEVVVILMVHEYAWVSFTRH